MHFLIISRPRFPIPPEQLPAMLEALGAWRKKYRSVTEYTAFFAGGGGGFGVVDVKDEAELNQIMLDFPFAPSSDIEIKALIAFDKGMDMWNESIRARMAAMGGG